MQNSNITNLGHCRNHYFNLGPNCIKLCVESTSWLLVVEFNASANVINLCVKLTSEKLELEIHMNYILAFQFDSKLLLLTSRM
jgi:hypothetical protein